VKQKGNNIAASVKQRLLNISKERDEDPNLVFIRYAIERLLYRISCSVYSTRFILKGAMLFAAWRGKTYRPTKDIDLLGFGDASAEGLRSIFCDLCRIEVEPDGMEFIEKSIQITGIREDLEYPGQRVKMESRLGNARINIQIDIGFGDSIVPEPAEITYPTLLEMPAPHIYAYPPETVVAEKLESIVSRGILNSRMKDYYDLKILSADFPFDGRTMTKAIEATFTRRGTAIPKDTPVGLAEEFSSSPDKKTQWKAFLKTSKLEDTNMDLSRIIDDIHTFLMPLVIAAANNRLLNKNWPAGGPWTYVDTEIAIR
jgi:predicted nucleotidyltransferase component of viral defense system